MPVQRSAKAVVNGGNLLHGTHLFAGLTELVRSNYGHDREAGRVSVSDGISAEQDDDVLFVVVEFTTYGE